MNTYTDTPSINRWLESREVNKYRKADKQAKIPTSGKSGNSVEKEITGQPMQRDESKDK